MKENNCFNITSQHVFETPTATSSAELAAPHCHVAVPTAKGAEAHRDLLEDGGHTDQMLQMEQGCME
eukprot:7620863-Heterocapsa_arctica.AAC.1